MRAFGCMAVSTSLFLLSLPPADGLASESESDGILNSGKGGSNLDGAIFLGQLLAPMLGKFFSKINPGTGMKVILAVSFGLINAATVKALNVLPYDIFP